MALGRCALTGAFGFTGKYIARVLLARGAEVVTLTNRPAEESAFSEPLPTFPLSFDDPPQLVRSLTGVDVLFNTYWIRFSHKRLTFAKAAENSKILINCAKEAGARKVVHISITNASLTSPLPYFRYKAQVEEHIRASGLPFAIIRPALIFGEESILINNIAWMLRRFPIFAIPGSGEYRLRPIFVEDLAKLVVAAAEEEDNTEKDAVGPEVFRFRALVEEIARAVGSSARIVCAPPWVAFALARGLGVVVRDVVLTKDEVAGLMQELLMREGPATGETPFTQWLSENAAHLGVQYFSELKRHYARRS